MVEGSAFCCLSLIRVSLRFCIWFLFWFISVTCVGVGLSCIFASVEVINFFNLSLSVVRYFILSWLMLYAFVKDSILAMVVMVELVSITWLVTSFRICCFCVSVGFWIVDNCLFTCVCIMLLASLVDIRVFDVWLTIVFL